MALYIIGKSVQGTSHILQNKICQDAFDFKWIEENKVLAVSVADGHGSASCMYSDEGAQIATQLFCSIMSDLYHGYSDKPNVLKQRLEQAGAVAIAKKIVDDWRQLIIEAHKRNDREFPKAESDQTDSNHALFHMYGTTLLGMLITPDFHFAFQLGDGDITRVINGDPKTIVDSDQLLGVETHSISEIEPWNYAHIMLQDVSKIDDRFAYIISTDGFKNSHASKYDYIRSCAEYIETVKMYGLKAVEDNLPNWLNETSKEGCGDDITVVIITTFDRTEDSESTDQTTEQTSINEEAVQNEELHDEITPSSLDSEIKTNGVIDSVVLPEEKTAYEINNPNTTEKQNREDESVQAKTDSPVTESISETTIVYDSVVLNPDSTDETKEQLTERENPEQDLE